MLHGNPSAFARDFFPGYGSPSTAFFAECAFPVLCVLLQGTLGYDFGESTAWVLLWKTRSRPIGVRVCPVAQFDFFSTAFDPPERTIFFGNKNLPRHLQLITPENGGDETSSPSPPRFTFFDDLDVPLDPLDTPMAPPGSKGSP